jgi:hypothetical protein
VVQLSHSGNVRSTFFLLFLNKNPAGFEGFDKPIHRRDAETQRRQDAEGFWHGFTAETRRRGGKAWKCQKIGREAEGGKKPQGRRGRVLADC